MVTILTQNLKDQVAAWQSSTSTPAHMTWCTYGALTYIVKFN